MRIDARSRGIALKARFAQKDNSPEHHFPIQYHFLESVQRCMTLYLASLDRYSGQAEAGKLRNLDGIQLGSIEPSPHRRKSPCQCPVDRGFCRFAECLRRVRVRQPHEVPANAADSRVQLHCHGPDSLCPSLGKRLLKQSEVTRQDTSIPQEYCVDLHCCPLPREVRFLFAPKPAIGITTAGMLGEESRRMKLPIERGAFAAVPERSITVALGCWLIGLARPNLIARRAAKYSSTSTFLIRLIAVPLSC